jgi:hypothetical protein
MLGIDFDLQLSPQLRRHPDGVKAGDSERAIANNDSGHFYLPGWRCSDNASAPPDAPVVSSGDAAARMRPLLIIQVKSPERSITSVRDPFRGLRCGNYKPSTAVVTKIGRSFMASSRHDRRRDCRVNG